ncbi:hypothetical protein Droror1_Dr00012093 [Drosera rotundifolia]
MGLSCSYWALFDQNWPATKGSCGWASFGLVVRLQGCCPPASSCCRLRKSRTKAAHKEGELRAKTMTRGSFATQASRRVREQRRWKLAADGGSMRMRCGKMMGEAVWLRVR